MKLKVKSQSSLKDLERSDGCPMKWRSRWIDGSIPSTPSEDMSKGIYFETLCIGEGAQGQKLDSLPLTSTGKMTADQARIEEQANAFKMYFDESSELYLGFKILDTQVVVGDEGRQGVIDIVAEDKDGQVCHIDLKATSNVYNTYGNYAWGAPERMDFIQQVLYAELYKKQFGVNFVRTLLLVFDWSPNMGKKLIELEVSPEAISGCWDRFESADEIINEYENDYWPTLPSKKECEGCPLSCKDRFNVLEVEKISLTI